LYEPLLALALAMFPALSIASCLPGVKPSYQDISAIYFHSEGVTEPVAIHSGHPVMAGACPVSVDFYASPSHVDKAGDGTCHKDRAGRVYACCPTEYNTDDFPQRIFNRLVAALAKDRFYDIVESSQPMESPPPLRRVGQSDNAAFYSIVAMRCGAQPGTRQAKLNTSTLALSIPIGSLPGATYDSKIIMLFDDFTRAIYQSQWLPGDVY
jgi:hypothetical protein